MPNFRTLRSMRQDLRTAARGSGGREGVASKWLNRLWAVQAASDLLNAVSPRVARGVDIDVIGFPEAQIDRLVRLALSLGSGICKDIQSVSDRMVSIDVDYINKVVKVQIAYSTGSIPALFSDGLSMMRDTFSEKVFGGGWPAPLNHKGVNGLLVPIDDSDGRRAVPPLPKGELLITSEPHINPQLANGRGTSGATNGADIFEMGQAPLTGACDPIPDAKHSPNADAGQYFLRPASSIYRQADYARLRRLIGDAVSAISGTIPNPNLES